MVSVDPDRLPDRPLRQIEVLAIEKEQSVESVHVLFGEGVPAHIELAGQIALQTETHVWALSYSAVGDLSGWEVIGRFPIGGDYDALAQARMAAAICRRDRIDPVQVGFGITEEG